MESIEINKSKICLYPINQIRTVTINILIKAGSWYEKSDNWGKFHLLEHLLFQGTKKFKTNKQIEDFKHKHGLYLNASTSGNYINIYINCPDIKIDESLKLLEEITFNPIFPKEKFKKELNIIIQEYKDKWDQPYNRFTKKFYQNIYGKKSFINRDALGQPDFLKKIKQKEITTLHKKFFQPQNITIGVVGNFDNKIIKNKIKKILNKYKNNFKSKLPQLITKKGENFFNYSDQVNQTYLIINWYKNKKYSFEERIALNMASYILASSTNSILFKKIRQKLALVYNINCSSFARENTQNFEIWSSFNSQNTQKIINTIKNEIKKFISQPITKKTFEKNKNYMNLRTIVAFDNPNYISKTLTKNLFYEKKIYSPEKIIEIANKITPKKLKKILQEIFQEKNMTIGIMTPNKPENN